MTGLDVLLLPEELQRKEITNCLIVHILIVTENYIVLV
jgi:hypothetical protein